MDARDGRCQHLDLTRLWKLIKQEQKISTQNKHHYYLNFVFKMCQNDFYKHWADLKLALFSWTKSAKKCVTTGFLPQALLISEWTDTKTDNWGNPTLPEHCLPAGTEIRHFFLVHEDLLQWSSLRTSSKRHNLVQQKFILHLQEPMTLSVEDVSRRRNRQKALQKHYIILYTSCLHELKGRQLK